jgi:hypothetical protein
MDALPPIFNSRIFNESAFTTSNYLTLQQADLLYTPLSFILGITNGQALPNRVLILDSSSSIQAINQVGAQGLTISSTNNNSLSISNTSPAGIANIKLTNDTSESFELGMRGSSAVNPNSFYIYDNANSQYRLVLDQTGQMYINANVCIGITSTVYKLHVNGNMNISAGTLSIGGTQLVSSTLGISNITACSLTSGASGYIHSYSTYSLSTYIDTFTGDCSIGSNTSNNFSLFTGNVNRLTALSTGQISINTISNSKQLNINSTTGNCLRLIYNNALNTETNYVDHTVSSVGLYTITPTGTSPSITLATVVTCSNTTDATSSAGALIVAGGINIAKSAYITNKLNIGMSDTTCKLNLYATGNHIQLVNTLSGSTPTTYSNIAVDSSGNLNITNYVSSVPSSTQLSASGWLGLNNIGAPRYTVDLGTNDTSIKICLKQLNNTAGTPTYGIGTLSGNVTISTGAGYQLWLSSNPGTLSSLIQSTSSALHQIYSTATMFPNNSWIGTPGYQNQISLSSAGGLLVGSNTQSYTSNWLEVAASGSGHSALFKGGVVIGTTTSSSFPLYVGSTSTTSYTGSYGWLASSGSGSSANFTGRSFSIYSEGGIFAATGEIDCASDIRLKTDIVDITESDATKFIDGITPIEFKYLNCVDTHYGFSAQELIKLGLSNCVGFREDNSKQLKPMDIECDDGQSIHVESNQSLVVNLLSMIPLLTKALQIANDRISKLEEKTLPKSGCSDLSAASVTLPTAPRPRTKTPYKRIGI